MLRSQATRDLWARLLHARYRLFQRHRYDRLALEEVAGRPFLVLPHVFNPALFGTGRWLAESLEQVPIAPDSTVLDVGTGSGVTAILAAPLAKRVVAIDVNPAAVRCARINALLNRVEDRVEVLEGDLFEPVRGRRFDVVLFNPPFYRGEPRDALDRAWRSLDVVERFAAHLGEHLTPGGHARVILSSRGATLEFLRVFRARALSIETLWQRDVVNEVLTIHRLTPDLSRV